MPFADQFIQAFQAGSELTRRKEQGARQDEELKLQQRMLKFRMDDLRLRTDAQKFTLKRDEEALQRDLQKGTYESYVGTPESESQILAPGSLQLQAVFGKALPPGILRQELIDTGSGVKRRPPTLEQETGRDLQTFENEWEIRNRFAGSNEERRLRDLTAEFVADNGRDPNAGEKVRLRADAARLPRDPELASMNNQIKIIQLEMLRRNQNEGGMTPEQANIARALSDDFRQEAADSVIRMKSFRTIREAARVPSAAGDLSMIFAFMKMLDPTSVVRESEQASAAEARGVPEAVWSLYNRMLTGERLGPNQRDDFVNQAQLQFEGARVELRELSSVYEQRGLQQGIPSEMAGSVVIDYESILGLSDATDESSGAVQPGAEFNYVDGALVPVPRP
jgi:hypothetical protein